MKPIDQLVPGFAAAMERIPGTLAAYDNLTAALEAGVLPMRTRAQIALVVAQQIRCEYCIWAHERLAEDAGLSAEEIFFARLGTARSRREAAIVKLAQMMICNGELRERIECDPAFARIFGETEIAEILAHVARAVLTCYVLQTLAPATRRAKTTRT